MIILLYAQQDITKAACAVILSKDKEIPFELPRKKRKEGLTLKEFYRLCNITDETLSNIFPDPVIDKEFREGRIFPAGGECVQEISNLIGLEIIIYYSAEKNDPILLRGHYVPNRIAQKQL